MKSFFKTRKKHEIHTPTTQKFSIYIFFYLCTVYLASEIKLYYRIKIVYFFAENIGIFEPKSILKHPLTDIPNWIPAPIPYYTPPPIIPYIRMNDAVRRCSRRYNKTIPEVPTVINSIENALVLKNGQILTSSYYYLEIVAHKYRSVKQIQKIDRERQTIFNITQYEVIEQAIPWFHLNNDCYFHFLIETFPLILSYGTKIMNSSVLLHGKILKHQFNDVVDILGIKFKKTKFVGNPVFVKKLYITNPHFFDGCNPNALRHFRHMILSRLGIYNLTATEYVIYNRRNNRKILNFNEVLSAISKEISEVKFIIPPQNMTDMRTQIRFYRKAKMIVMVHGSTIANMIFMHRSSVVLELAKKDCRATFVRLHNVIGNRLYEILFTNQTDYFFSQWVEIPPLIKAIKYILQQIDK